MKRVHLPEHDSAMRWRVVTACGSYKCAMLSGLNSFYAHRACMYIAVWYVIVPVDRWNWTHCILVWGSRSICCSRISSHSYIPSVTSVGHLHACLLGSFLRYDIGEEVMYNCVSISMSYRYLLTSWCSNIGTVPILLHQDVRNFWKSWRYWK